MTKKASPVEADPASPVPGVVVEMAGAPAPGERLPMQEPDGGWPPDEFTGVGGSYVRDPFTGVRTRVVAVGSDQ